jgi:hypothetical protein
VGVLAGADNPESDVFQVQDRAIPAPTAHVAGPAKVERGLNSSVGSNPTVSAQKVLVRELFRIPILKLCPHLPRFCPQSHRLNYFYTLCGSVTFPAPHQHLATFEPRPSRLPLGGGSGSGGHSNQLLPVDVKSALP